MSWNRKSAWEIRATPGDGLPAGTPVGVAPNACPIRERTGDGVSVGRCWYHCPGDVCPRHGDVSAPLATYRATGRLTDENELPVSPATNSASTPRTGRT